MIAISRRDQTTVAKDYQVGHAAAAWHEPFLDLLPAIRRHARFAFRELSAEPRDEALQDVIAHALVAFISLFKQGRADLAYPGVLARYAVARIRDGRHVGEKVNSSDVTSLRCWRRHGVRVGSLDQIQKEGEWREVLVEDRSASPADIAAARIDFRDWLTTLSPQTRRIALLLASGEKTRNVARRFGVTSGRISQLRYKLRKAWNEFQGEVCP